MPQIVPAVRTTLAPAARDVGVVWAHPSHYEHETGLVIAANHSPTISAHCLTASLVSLGYTNVWNLTGPAGISMDVCSTT